MKLSQLLAALPHIIARSGEGDPDITQVTADSRQVIPGALFVARRGETVDGHDFIPQAIERGAAAVVREKEGKQGNGSASSFPSVSFITVPDSRLALAWLSAAWHGFPARRLVMIGVTGTDGKTTTATLIHSILRAAGLRAGLISTVGAVIGEKVLDTGFHVTTPEAPEVQRYLAQMVAAGFSHCVLEATSHGLHQQRVAACEFDVAVVTNITHEHLDYHKTFENYRAAKAMLFTGLSAAARKPGVEKAGVLNADDDSFDYLSRVFAEKRLTYSLRATADFVARRIRFAPDATHFDVAFSNLRSPISISTPLVGAFNVSNCLAALAATIGALGIAPEAAQRGIAELRGVPGRMERIDLGQPFTALVDFAHTPNALRRALETARGMLAEKSARVIAVFGSAGLRDIEKRRLMAETAAELADLTVLTAEDPRTESLTDILEMMAYGARSRGGVEGVTFFRVPDRGEALRFAVRLARPGDIVLACGKGHEQSMCFGETEYPWDDRIALRAALAELLGVPGPAMPKLPTSLSR
ncbi:MAG: UDP-N-acetylmuramoyl-L-alanyl-D-glutamate--2,6-diaminopimelate ligase [Anaerolineales bacterium]|nr:UDP-N-acetylmuramoyl-L-alanyl-D-glutamate--2,6-diaminopimelate ligase [Anaerolineales bacterium]